MITKMKRNQIAQAMEENNPWWKGHFSLQFRPREIYEELRRFFPTRQILALTGLRRVGKTTLLFKMVDDFLQEFKDPTVVFYFSFDDFASVRVREVVELYARFHGKNLGQGKYLFLFDEIQKVNGWEDQIKRLYDAFENIKIIISGSESLFLRKKSHESLAGRIFEFVVYPLTFREFLQFKGQKIEPFIFYKNDILREFRHFLLCNGFPEIINQPEEIIRRYVKETVVEKVIYRDIPRVFPVQDSSLVEQLLSLIAAEPGQILHVDTLANELGITRQTVSRYLDYLEKSFLLRRLYNFSRNPRKTQRKMKKYYPVVLLPETLDKPELFGKIFETCIVHQLHVDFFWRDTYQHEVDIVLMKDKIPLPIEVKTGKIDPANLRLFMKKFAVSEGIILVYDAEGQQLPGGIKVIPFYEYLLKS